MNKNILTYKGYCAKIEYSIEDLALIGKVIGVTDTLVFECDSASEVENRFHEVIDDYLDMCERYGKDPERPCKGTFNVRVPEEIHRKALISATQQGISLNEFVSQAIKAALSANLETGAYNKTESANHIEMTMVEKSPVYYRDFNREPTNHQGWQRKMTIPNAKQLS